MSTPSRSTNTTLRPQSSMYHQNQNHSLTKTTKRQSIASSAVLAPSPIIPSPSPSPSPLSKSSNTNNSPRTPFQPILSSSPPITTGAPSVMEGGGSGTAGGGVGGESSNVGTATPASPTRTAKGKPGGRLSSISKSPTMPIGGGGGMGGGSNPIRRVSAPLASSTTMNEAQNGVTPSSSSPSSGGVNKDSSPPINRRLSNANNNQTSLSRPPTSPLATSIVRTNSPGHGRSRSGTAGTGELGPSQQQQGAGGGGATGGRLSGGVGTLAANDPKRRRSAGDYTPSKNLTNSPKNNILSMSAGPSGTSRPQQQQQQGTPLSSKRASGPGMGNDSPIGKKQTLSPASAVRSPLMRGGSVAPSSGVPGSSSPGSPSVGMGGGGGGNKRRARNSSLSMSISTGEVNNPMLVDESEGEGELDDGLEGELGLDDGDYSFQSGSQYGGGDGGSMMNGNNNIPSSSSSPLSSPSVGRLDVNSRNNNKVDGKKNTPTTTTRTKTTLRGGGGGGGRGVTGRGRGGAAAGTGRGAGAAGRRSGGGPSVSVSVTGRRGTINGSTFAGSGDKSSSDDLEEIIGTDEEAEGEGGHTYTLNGGGTTTTGTGTGTGIGTGTGAGGGGGGRNRRTTTRTRGTTRTTRTRPRTNTNTNTTTTGTGTGIGTGTGTGTTDGEDQESFTISSSLGLSSSIGDGEEENDENRPPPSLRPPPIVTHPPQHHGNGHPHHLDPNLRDIDLDDMDLLLSAGGGRHHPGGGGTNYLDASLGPDDSQSHLDLEDTSQPSMADRDEDLLSLLSKIERLHLRKLGGLKRLLGNIEEEGARGRVGMLGEIQALRESQTRLNNDSRYLRSELENCRLRERKLNSELDRLKASRIAQSVSGGRSTAGTIFSEEDEDSMRLFYQELDSNSRAKLLHMMLAQTLPGDALTLKKYLEEHARTHFDLVKDLPEPVTLKIFEFLSMEEGASALARCWRVSKQWSSILSFHATHLYRLLSLRLTASDPVPLSPSALYDWKSVYKSLHFRESRWRTGKAQEVSLWRDRSGAKGAPGGVGNTTCGKLADGVLVIAADETVRVFDTPSGRSGVLSLRKTFSCPGPISCMDYLPGPNIICAGSSNHARIVVMSLNSGAVLQKLQGQSKGLKVVALSSRYVLATGYDKSIVATNWKTNERVARFGQQTEVAVGLSFVDDHRFVSFQSDGVVRTYDLAEKQVLAQFPIAQLVRQIPDVSTTFGRTEPLIWGSAASTNLAIASKNLMVHLRLGKISPNATNATSSTASSSSSSPPATAQATPEPSNSVRGHNPQLSSSSSVPSKKPLGEVIDLETPPVIEACVSTAAEISSTLGVFLNQKRIVTVTRPVGRQGGGDIYINHLGEQMALAGVWQSDPLVQQARQQQANLDVRLLAADHSQMIIVTTDGRVFAVGFLGDGDAPDDSASDDDA